jgi:DNA-binding winged helix-turn-helix (wHTH) protein
MDVLVLLAERADQAVSKDELIDRVWKRQYVTDDVLTVTIYALRKALGDDARQPQYIETVSRRGYRLLAPVRAVATRLRNLNRARNQAWWDCADRTRRLRRGWGSCCSRRERCGR